MRRQQEALSKLPEEDRARMMRPDELVGTVSAGQLVSPGLLELAEAREVALRANPSIHSARARLEAALARIAEARSFYFPQLALTHNSTRTMLTPSTRSRLTSGIASTPAIPQLPQDPTLTDILSLLQIPLLNRGSSTTSNANSFSDHSSILSATWTLFDGFAREARMMSAKYGYRASAMAVGDVERLVVQAVDTAYYQAQLGREQVRIARADEAFSREQLVDAEKRFEARKITKADVLNFEVRVRSAQADLVAAIGLRDTARVLLAELLGLSGAKLADDVDLAELEAETEEELTAPSTDDWIERALGGRPDYAQARHTVKARAEEVSLAQGQFSPELTLSGTYGFERASNLGYSVNDQSAAVGLELRWQLFTGGFRTSQVRRVQAEWWEAAAELERKRLEVVADVRSTTVGLIDAQEQVRLQRLNLESARENRRIVQLEYSAGKASLVRLNEAQRDYVNTDAELARSRIRLRQAWSDLRASAGAYSSHGSAEAESAP
ncbi:MAG: TolC family protein [bacterium]|nr:TolC family protein [bacterium]